MFALEKLTILSQTVPLLRVDFLLKTDSGYLREEGDFVVSPQDRIGAPARISNTQTVQHAVGDVFFKLQFVVTHVLCICLCMVS